MPGAQDEPVAIQPTRLIGIVPQRVPVEHRANLRTP